MSPIMKVTRGRTGTVAIEQVSTGERRLNPSERERLRLLQRDEELRAAATADASVQLDKTENSDSKKGGQAKKARGSKKMSKASTKEEDDIVAMLEDGLGPDPDPLGDEDVLAEAKTQRSHQCPHCDFVAGSAKGLASHIEARHADDTDTTK